jgi:DNA-binding NtrC family response regulator
MKGDGNYSMIGTSTPMLILYDRIEKVAYSSLSVHLEGESGTGKELVARAIHSLTPNSKTFVAFNCAGVPETLIESTLFGSEKGAYTGADKRTIGLIERAVKGTLMLDEIGDMPKPMQAKLLRAMEYEFCRLGGSEHVRPDCRFITAGSSSLEDKLREGTLREEFYFRLNGARLQVPSLRDRGADDILLLSTSFIGSYVKTLDKDPADVLTLDAKEALTTYSWPGNVRQLMGVIKTACGFMQDDRISANDLTPLLVDPALFRHKPLATPPATMVTSDRQVKVLGGLVEKFKAGTPLNEMERHVLDSFPALEAAHRLADIHSNVDDILSRERALEAEHGMPYELIRACISGADGKPAPVMVSLPSQKTELPDRIERLRGRYTPILYRELVSMSGSNYVLPDLISTGVLYSECLRTGRFEPSKESNKSRFVYVSSDALPLLFKHLTMWESDERRAELLGPILDRIEYGLPNGQGNDEPYVLVKTSMIADPPTGLQSLHLLQGLLDTRSAITEAKAPVIYDSQRLLCFALTPGSFRGFVPESSEEPLTRMIVEHYANGFGKWRVEHVPTHSCQ